MIHDFTIFKDINEIVSNASYGYRSSYETTAPSKSDIAFRMVRWRYDLALYEYIYVHDMFAQHVSSKILIKNFNNLIEFKLIRNISRQQ